MNDWRGLRYEYRNHSVGVAIRLLQKCGMYYLFYFISDLVDVAGLANQRIDVESFHDSISFECITFMALGSRFSLQENTIMLA